MNAVVVLSGGQDSATCLALAIRKHGVGNVAALTFAYGQRHAIETKFAKRLAKRFGVVLHKVIRLDFYKQLTNNALLDPAMKISQCGETKPRLRLGASSTTPPNTVVEGRNAIFLQLAAVWAKTLGATEVYTGVSEADFSGYPDCREAFIRAEQKAIRLALDYPVRIVTPFMHMSKADEWALAARLGIFDIIRDETVTCYNGVPGDGCGKCPSCKLRNRGLREYLKAKATGEGEELRPSSGRAAKGTRHSCRVRRGK